MGVLARVSDKDMQLDGAYPFRSREGQELLHRRVDAGPDGIMQKAPALSLSWWPRAFAIPRTANHRASGTVQGSRGRGQGKVLEGPAVFQQVRGNPFNHHMFTLGWVTSNADADYSLYALFHSKQVPPAGWNTSRYANARVDALVEQARRSLNQSEREKLYFEVQDILAKEMVWIPVTPPRYRATKTAVKGFTIHPVEYNLWLGKAWLDK